ncbi:MAG TPA: DinB family protein [Chryseolinea sp.]|nr:DinB family protein [Chryseolinea sp.]
MRNGLFVLAYLLFALSASCQQLTQEEREFVIGMLEENGEKFLADIDKISETQWKYKPAAGQWSVAEISEHITLSDGLLLSVAQNSLKSAADNSKANSLVGKENSMIERLKDRTQKSRAPEVLVPTNRYATKKDLIAAFKIEREKTIVYVKNTKDPLKNHIASHPLFGELTAYQWLVMIPAHANRHLAQLEEVMEMKEFPTE